MPKLCLFNMGRKFSKKKFFKKDLRPLYFEEVINNILSPKKKCFFFEKIFKTFLLMTKATVMPFSGGWVRGPIREWQQHVETNIKHKVAIYIYHFRRIGKTCCAAPSSPPKARDRGRAHGSWLTIYHPFIRQSKHHITLHALMFGDY